MTADKNGLVLSLMQRNGIYDPDTAVLIGDSKYDINAAISVGIDSVGVIYGFTSYADMVSYNPDYLVQSVDELTVLLTGNPGG